MSDRQLKTPSRRRRSTKKLATIVLAAGDGKRLHSAVPKALHGVCGKPMLSHVLDGIANLDTFMNVIVVGFEHQIIRKMYQDRDLKYVHQKDRRGTGHAVMVTQNLFKNASCDVMVLYGDTPLLRASTMGKLLERHRHQDAAATILTTVMEDPTGYGRVLRNADNTVLSIVEDKDANIYEKQIREINTGSYCFDSKELFHALAQITPTNKQNELYLTDVIKVLVKEDKRVEAYTCPDGSEALGVNNRLQLAMAEKVLRRRILERLMTDGVSVVDPENTYIDEGVSVGKDTIIEPYCVLQGHTSIGEGCRIGPGAHLISCAVGSGSHVYHSVLEHQKVPSRQTVGPFVYITGKE